MEEVFGEMRALAPLIQHPRKKLGPGDPGFQELLTGPYLEALIYLDLVGSFYYQLESPDILPPPIREGMWRRIIRQAAREMKLQKAEALSLEILKGRGLEAIPIKGLDYGRVFKCQPGERPTKDVDLLLPKEQFVEAVEVLKGQGFNPIKRYPFEVAWESVHDFALVAPELKVVVELHHHFFDVGSIRHLGEDEHGLLMPLFFNKGVKSGELTHWGRWWLSAIRWVSEGCHRGLALRDMVETHSLWPQTEEMVRSNLNGSGLEKLIMFAWEMSEVLVGKKKILSQSSKELCQITQGTIEHPLINPGRTFWKKTRPIMGIKKMIKSVVFPGRNQLELILKRKLSGPLEVGIAHILWWAKGFKS